MNRQSICLLCRDFLYKSKKSESVTDNGEFRIFIFWWRWRIARWASALTGTPRLKTAHRAVFLTAVSITALKICGTQKRTADLVEMAVIETASWNNSSGLSTCLVCYLRFPRRYGSKQPYRFGRLWYLTGAEPLSRSCSPLHDARSEAAARNGRTKAA